MKWPTEQDWSAWGIRGDLEKLFYLRWLELFSEGVLDTWQVRTLNARSAISEVIAIIGVAKEHPVYLHNLPFAVAEAQILAAEDPVLALRYPFVSDFLKPFLGKKSGELDIRRLDATCKQAQSALARYCDHVVDAICEIVSGDDIRPKERLLQLTLCLATELRNRGYAMDSLLHATSLLQDGSNGAFADRIRLIAARCSGTEIDYRCYIQVTFPAQAMFGSDGRVMLVQGAELRHELPDHRAFVAGGTDQYARVRVRAVDPAGAVASAREKVAGLLAAHSFYEPEKTFEWRGDEALIVWQGGSEQRRFSAVRGYLKNAKNPDSRVAKLLELRSRLRDADWERLAAALEYHRLASTAPSDEARLVNLWTALESLVRHTDESIIADVTGLVPAVAAVSYVHQLMTGLAILLRKAWSSTPRLHGIISEPGSSWVDPGKLLQLLLAAADDTKLRLLYDALSGWPLLVNRVHYLRERVFKSPKALRESLCRHRLNIDWQVRRVYRARNQVMHQATRPQHLAQLIQHLHTYFSCNRSGAPLTT